MRDDIRLSDEEDELEDNEGLERGIGESEDEFDDDDEDDDAVDEEEEDEDLDSPRGVDDDRTFTSEIGSEGGSQGDIEAERRKPRVMRGSEAGTTAETDDRPVFGDRQAGGGVGRPRN